MAALSQPFFNTRGGNPRLQIAACAKDLNAAQNYFCQVRFLWRFNRSFLRRLCLLIFALRRFLSEPIIKFAAQSKEKCRPIVKLLLVQFRSKERGIYASSQHEQREEWNQNLTPCSVLLFSLIALAWYFLPEVFLLYANELHILMERVFIA